MSGGPLDLRFPQWRPQAVRSLWLQEAFAREPAAAEPLAGSARADVCIVGGGFTGLWTAIRLLERDPSLAVTVLEADVCGGGASGRNGGFVAGWTPKLATLVRLFGPEEALRLNRATLAAIDELEAFCAAEAPEAAFERGGWLWTATSEAQRGTWAGAVEAARQAGIDVYRELEPGELERRLGPSRHLAGVEDVTAAKVQPALLARALVRRARAAGARIHEGTPVTAIGPAGGAPGAVAAGAAETLVRCAGGEVRARVVVLAANAWLAHLAPFRRALIVTSSDVAATAPDPELLAAQGWTGAETVSNSKLMLDYYRTTLDGRVVLGRGGGTLARANRVGPAFERSPRQVARAAADIRWLFPGLAAARDGHGWSGPIDRSEVGLPWFGELAGGGGRVVYGVGFSGNGVGPCVVAGRILASLALGRDDEWASLAATLGRVRRGALPGEPLRYVAGRLVQAGVAAKERAEDAGRRPPRLAVALARKVPQGAGVHDVEER